MKPPLTNNLWLTASASAGSSRKVGMNAFDQRIGLPFVRTHIIDASGSVENQTRLRGGAAGLLDLEFS